MHPIYILAIKQQLLKESKMSTLKRKSFLISTTALVLGSLAFISSCNATSFDPGLKDYDAVRVAAKSVDTKKYMQTEAEFLKTAQKLEKAQAKHQKTDDLMADFVDLGQSLHKQAQNGAQVELMSKELEKSSKPKSTIKEKFESAKQTVKSIFTHSSKDKAVDGRDELNVLCLDGGGVRGIGTLLMLVDLEMRTGKKVHEMFDRIYGTSTGGLMAILLAKGMAASEVLDIYFNNMNKIFYRSWSDTFLNPLGLVNATYNPEGLEGIIKQYAGDGTLKDVKIPVAVTCVDKATQKVRLLSSDSDKTKDIKILEAARATSAAPTYFPAQEVNMKGKKFMAVDGGVGANNPAEEALNDIKKKFGAQYKVNMLSLGTGIEEKVKLHDQAGKLGFGSPANIPGYFMGTNEANIAKRMKEAHKRGEIADYSRFNFALPFKIDLADTSEKAKNALLELAFKQTQQDDWKSMVKKMRESNRA
jgi:predicted acylesterase/phospholipase RssA